MVPASCSIRRSGWPACSTRPRGSASARHDEDFGQTLGRVGRGGRALPGDAGVRTLSLVRHGFGDLVDPPLTPFLNFTDGDAHGEAGRLGHLPGGSPLDIPGRGSAAFTRRSTRTSSSGTPTCRTGDTGSMDGNVPDDELLPGDDPMTWTIRGLTRLGSDDPRFRRPGRRIAGRQQVHHAAQAGDGQSFSGKCRGTRRRVPGRAPIATTPGAAASPALSTRADLAKIHGYAAVPANTASLDFSRSPAVAKVTGPVTAIARCQCGLDGPSGGGHFLWPGGAPVRWRRR